jgi:hypothetical protein
MKTCFRVLVVLCLSVGVDVFAGITIETTSGKVYEDAEVKKLESGSVLLVHGGGVAKVALADLSKPVRQSLGIQPTLEMAKADFDGQIGAFKKPLFELDVSYAGHLAKLEKEAQSQGLLDEVLAVKKELAEFRQGVPRGEIQFEKLKDLRAVYDRERMKRRNKIVDDLEVVLGQYQVELKEIQKNLTIANKVDEAIVAKKEEERVVALLADRKQALDTLGLFSPKEIGNAGSGRPSQPSGAMANTGGSGATASKGKPFENSLGMKFVPVPITGGPSDGKTILFSIWETRVEDYESFINKNQGREWPDPGFQQGKNHPAVQVSWEDAVAFCEWLTETERKKGTIGSNDVYRLPTDHEWSCAVGIGKEEDGEALPFSKHNQLVGIYPWGKEWPPPKGAGNYYGEEANANPIDGSPGPILAGYRDDFDRTAPVGSFNPNPFGLYDLSGNASEWCEGWFHTSNKERRVVRGMNWMGAGNFPTVLQSSYRATLPPDKNYRSIGFRVVLERP